MSKVDAFTKRRLEKFISDLRSNTGQLPTLRDFEENGFSKNLIDRAVREKILEQLYVNLSNGVIVKGYKFKQ